MADLVQQVNEMKLTFKQNLLDNAKDILIQEFNEMLDEMKMKGYVITDKEAIRYLYQKQLEQSNFRPDIIQMVSKKEIDII